MPANGRWVLIRRLKGYGYLVIETRDTLLVYLQQFSSKSLAADLL